MSKILKMTPEIMEGMRKEFETALKTAQIVDGKFSFTKSFQSDNRKATICFTPEAYAKMTALVQAFDKEVAWHFVTERGEEPNTYLIYDVLVYPQTVAAATVDMDVEAYAAWKETGLRSGDERFFHLHGQGHSHVNMSTGPSPTDMNHQRGILADLRPSGFYIFVIWNKRNEHTMWVYDLQENIVYEDRDLTLKIGDSDLTGFVSDAKALVKTQMPAPTKWTGGYTAPKPVVSAQQAPVTVIPAAKQKEKVYAISRDAITRNASPYPDDDDPTSPFFVRDNYYGME